MEKFGIGIDIENISRFKKLDLKGNRLFFNRIYTEREKKYCLKKPFSPAHFAARFAGKEAIFKAINSFRKIDFPLNYKKIEITNNSKGVPLAKIKDKRLKDLDAKISLSHCREKAIAFCIVAKR